MNILISIIAVLLLSISAIISLYNMKYHFRISIFKYIIGVLIFSSILLVNSYTNMPPPLKPFITVITLIIISMLVLKRTLSESIASSIFLETICIMSESIAAMLLLIPNNSINLLEWSQTYNGIIFFNFLISLLIFIISILNFIRKLYIKFEKIINNLTSLFSSFTLFISLFVTFLMFFVTYKYYYSNQLAIYITIVLIFVFYIFIILSVVRTKINYEKIKNKYCLSLEDLNSYEEMLNQYKISVHENNNQLLIIRNMSKEETIKSYIDRLINNNEKDDKNIYNIIKRIPVPTIRASLYSKILLIKNKNISYEIEIDRKLTMKDFSKVPDNIILEISNILNVFLDNAVEEVINYKKKQILIEFNKRDDTIEIVISNICKKKIDVNDICNIGYTTKGGNHGYGLSLVKQILDKNKEYLENKTELTNNIFTQYLIIKTNKKTIRN